MNITKIKIVLCANAFFQEGYSYADCRIDAKHATDELEDRLMDAYPKAEVSVDWTSSSLPEHLVNVYVDDALCGKGDKAVADVRDLMLKVCEEVSNGTAS